MHKQRNRGQDGSGVASLKLNLSPGKRYISRYRSVKKDSIQDIFNKINKKFNKAKENQNINYIAVEIKFYRARKIWLKMKNENENVGYPLKVTNLELSGHQS